MNLYLRSIALLLFGQLLCASAAAGGELSEADKDFFQLKQQIETHYFAYDEEAHQTLLYRAHALTERHPNAWHPRYYAALINIQLGNIIRADNKDDAYRYYLQALENARSAHDISSNPETTIVLAAAYGKLASLRTLKMFYFGAKSKSTMIDAFRMDKRSPKSHLIIGVHTMWTPAVFGGSNDTARQFLIKALSLGSDWREPDRFVVRWATEPEILAHLAQLEIFCGDTERARDYVNEALAQVSDYGFVRRDILPQLD